MYTNMNANYKNEIIKIKNLFNAFYTVSFSNEIEENETNKANKLNIQKLIVTVSRDESLSDTDRQTIINEALNLFAEHTGCAEDYVIAKEILSFLEEKKLITQQNIDEFYLNSPINRWF